MKKLLGCKWKRLCKCVDKAVTCFHCAYYHPIDSGYGVCKGLPVFVVIPWCRDVCSLFEKDEKEV